MRLTDSSVHQDNVSHSLLDNFTLIVLVFRVFVSYYFPLLGEIINSIVDELLFNDRKCYIVHFFTCIDILYTLSEYIIRDSIMKPINHKLNICLKIIAVVDRLKSHEALTHSLVCTTI